MSSSRALGALMSMLACAFALALAGSTTHASWAGTAGPIAVETGSQPTGSTPPAAKGPVVLKIADRTVNFGGRFRLRGRTGSRQPGHVRIEARFGGRWQTVRKVGTDGDGRYRASVRARANTRFRATAGDGRRSEVRKVTVIGHVKLNRSARYVRLGNALRIRGTVVPRGRRVVRVRVRGEGVLTTRTGANGRFNVRWKPRKNGDFRYRVRALPSARSTGDASRFRRFSALRPGHASYYGPGLYGNGVACGGTLRPGTRGVAHKFLPCGTRVTLQYGKRTVHARVIDRGPYIAGRDWDLTEQTKRDLGFGGVGVVWTNK